MSKCDKFITWCDKAMAFSFYALIYFLPISIALAETFTGMALVFYLLKRGASYLIRSKGEDLRWHALSFSRNRIFFFLKCFKPIKSNLNIPIAIFLLWNLISTLISQIPSVSWAGFFGKTLQSAFIYFTFIECIRSRKHLKIFLTVFLISNTLICINGLYQSYVGHGFIFGHQYDGRISSSLRHANDFGAYLLIGIPILFCLSFLTDRKSSMPRTEAEDSSYLFLPKVKVLLIVSFMLALTCLGFTYSRGAWVGFILSLVLMSLFGLRSRKIIISNSLLIVFFLVIFYPGIMTNMRIPFLGIHSPSTSSSSVVKVDHVEHLQKRLNNRFRAVNVPQFLARNNRLGYWERSFSIIKDYPLFGCGLNTYALIAGRYSNGWGGYPHNSYLQMTAETGFVGITAFLWILFVLFRDSLRALRRIDIPANKILFFSFLTGLLGFLIHSFFDTNFYSVQLGSLLWIMIGVVVAFQKIELD